MPPTVHIVNGSYNCFEIFVEALEVIQARIDARRLLDEVDNQLVIVNFIESISRLECTL